MTRRLLLALVIALAAAPAAHAAGWTQVTATGGQSTDEVSAVRTSDNVLHVAWRRGGDLFHTRIRANGKVGGAEQIASGWAGLRNPALVAVPGGLRAFWGGIRTTNTDEPNRDLNTAFSPDFGASWQLQIGSIIVPGTQAYGSDVSAATLPDGTTLQAWAGPKGTWVHAGLEANTAPIVDYQAQEGGYGTLPGIAADASGQAMMAWFSSRGNANGVVAEAVSADGTIASDDLPIMPGTDTLTVGTGVRTPIAARGGSFYVVYPIDGVIRLWKTGDDTTAVIARPGGSQEATVAADPAGRLWVVWSEGAFGSKRVLAARSNRDATAFGAPVDAGVVKGAQSVSALDASPTAHALDILALFGTGDTATGQTYVTRVRPGLTLKARRAKHARVTYTVTDAGDPVRGATVKTGGRRGKTNSKGRITLRVKGRPAARATARGYEPATLKRQ